MSQLILSERAARIGFAPNAAAKARAQALAASGRTVIELTSGEPDFDTPEHIKKAAFDALAAGATKYTAAGGTADVRCAIVEKLHRENGLDFADDSVIVSNGAKHVIYNAFAATLRPGDQVIVPAPHWQSFPAMVSVNDGTPVIVASERCERYALTPERLESAIGARTRWVVLNAPSNPGGTVYDTEALIALAAVLRRHPHVWILLDEIYEHIRFDSGARDHFLTLAPDLAQRTLIVNGASKTYAMTGWRIGFGAGPRELIKAMTIVQSQSTSAPSSIGQAAYSAALRGDQTFVVTAARAYRERRDVLTRALQRVVGLAFEAPEGAFFAFVDCNALMGSRTPDGTVLQTDTDFVDYLLLQHGVASVDGTSFGSPGHFRLSFAADTPALDAAATRIAQAVAALDRVNCVNARAEPEPA